MNTLGEQLRFSANTLPTGVVNYANMCSEQLQFVFVFSTNQIPVNICSYRNRNT